MHKDNAKYYLPLVQALAEGKTIQYCSLSKWYDAVVVDLNHPPDHYRIKPERIKKKMWYKEGVTSMYEEGVIYLSAAAMIDNGWKLVEVEFDAP